MAEVLVEFSDPVKAEDGRVFMAQACGSEMQNGLWQGWIEFVPVGGGDPLRSTRATTQPNRQDTVYWATGLTPVYLEGALQRTLRPLAKALAPDQPVAAFFDGPAAAEDLPRAGAASVLNPFSLYRKGESLLRRQLGALSVLASGEHHRHSRAERRQLDGPECAIACGIDRNHRRRRPSHEPRRALTIGAAFVRPTALVWRS